MLTLITPTSDRPEAFALCERWMDRALANYGRPVRWIVIDDGERPVRCMMGQDYVRNEPRGNPVQSFLRNLMLGLECARAAGAEKILFIEDDDWYSPDYLTVQSARLDQADLVGEAQAKYYSVADRRYGILDNAAHASLSQTGMRANLVPLFLKIINQAGVPFVDRELWMSNVSKILAPESKDSIGIKGLPGKPGFTDGHAGQPALPEFDPSADVFTEWIGECAAQHYLPFSEIHKRAAIVVTCKGRLHHLKAALPLMLAQTYRPLQIVLVDYDCPDGSAPWAEEYAGSIRREFSLPDLPRLHALRVLQDASEFNLSRARNIGIRHTQADWCVMADADVLMPPDYASGLMADVLRRRWELCCASTDGATNSQCVVSRHAWRCVRGYDEAFRGWGHEDGDFYARIERHGFRIGKREDCGLSTLLHGDEESMRFYAQQDKAKTAAANAARKANVGRAVNPGGFGN